MNVLNGHFAMACFAQTKLFDGENSVAIDSGHARRQNEFFRLSQKGTRCSDIEFPFEICRYPVIVDCSSADR